MLAPSVGDVGGSNISVTNVKQCSRQNLNDERENGLIWVKFPSHLHSITPAAATQLNVQSLIIFIVKYSCTPYTTSILLSGPTKCVRTTFKIYNLTVICLL